MIYPSIDELLEKESNRYKLIILAGKRAHQIDEHNNLVLDNYRSVKPVGKALEEIVAGELYIIGE